MELEIERMQIFFPASLEIQEELLKAGFKVPYDQKKLRHIFRLFQAFPPPRE